jgi:hypothetical protein
VIDKFLTNFTFTVDGDRLRSPGLDFGYGDSSPHLIKLTSNYVLVKEPGSKNWSGRSKSTYKPASWSIWEIEYLFTKRGVEFRVVEVIEKRQPGKKWRTTKDEMLKKLHFLQRRHSLLQLGK